MKDRVRAERGGARQGFYLYFVKALNVFSNYYFVVLKIVLFYTQNVLLLFFLTSENRGVTVIP